MTFPNGFHGIKKIFTSEILDLIASVCMIICGALMIVFLASAETDASGGAIAGGLGAVAFLLAALVLSIIAYIFKLIGIKRAGRDDERFNTAFIFAIFALVLTVVSSAVTSISGTTTIWDDLIKTIATLFELLVTLYIVNGIQSLGEKLGHEELVAKGRTYFMLFLILYILRMIACVIPVFFGANETTASISGIMMLVAAILSLICYILYLILLGKAKKVLKAN